MEPYKLYRYIELESGKYTPSIFHLLPVDIDFKKGLKRRLHPKLIYANNGELTKIEYYDTISVDFGTGAKTYSDLIVEENFTYLRDGSGFALKETNEIIWYLENGQAGTETKVMEKWLSSEEIIKEGEQRRGHIIKDLQLTTVGILALTRPQWDAETRLQKGIDFMSFYRNEIKDYIDAAQGTLQSSILTDAETNHDWLDDIIDGNGTKIRDLFVAKLNYV